MQTFEYLAPTTIKAAVAALAAHKRAQVLAGGTDLLIRMKMGGASPGLIVDVKNIPGVKDLKIDRKKGRLIDTTGEIIDAATGESRGYIDEFADKT